MDSFDIYRIAEFVHVITLVERIQRFSLKLVSYTCCDWAGYVG